jgi:hypothetical protein
MANQDIIPFASPHGGHSSIRPIKIAGSTSYVTAETSWQKGEVGILTSGAIGAANAVIANGATNHNPAIHLVSVSSSQGELTIPNVASATATIAVLSPWIPVLGEQEFLTRNLFNNSNTAVVPLITHVGDICGWWRDNSITTGGGSGPNGRFGLDTNGTGLIITRVLNANYEDIGDHGGTGTYVVFKANGE